MHKASTPLQVSLFLQRNSIGMPSCFLRRDWFLVREGFTPAATHLYKTLDDSSCQNSTPLFNLGQNNGNISRDCSAGGVHFWICSFRSGMKWPFCAAAASQPPLLPPPPPPCANSPHRQHKLNFNLSLSARTLCILRYLFFSFFGPYGDVVSCFGEENEGPTDGKHDFWNLISNLILTQNKVRDKVWTLWQNHHFYFQLSRVRYLSGSL